MCSTVNYMNVWFTTGAKSRSGNLVVYQCPHLNSLGYRMDEVYSTCIQYCIM